MAGILDRQLSKRLKGKTAWISGGKRIGFVVARALAEQGVNLVISYRSSAKEAMQIASMAKKLKVKAIAVQADVSKAEDVRRALKEALAAFKRIEILVNMASVFNRIPMESVTRKDWDDNLGAHVLGTFWPMQILAPHMPRGAHIINIADRTSIGRMYRQYFPYVVTKAAVEAATRAAAKELGPQGIFVNAIAPGPILAPPGTPEREWKNLRESSPVKFPIDDQEAMEQFALLVLYLSCVTMASGFTYPLDQGHNV